MENGESTQESPRFRQTIEDHLYKIVIVAMVGYLGSAWLLGVLLR